MQASAMENATGTLMVTKKTKELKRMMTTVMNLASLPASVSDDGPHARGDKR
jgi:hypothetical protein